MKGGPKTPYLELAVDDGVGNGLLAVYKACVLPTVGLSWSAEAIERDAWGHEGSRLGWWSAGPPAVVKLRQIRSARVGGGVRTNEGVL
jgi:hypothetical protein